MNFDILTYIQYPLMNWSGTGVRLVEQGTVENSTLIGKNSMDGKCLEASWDRQAPLIWTRMAGNLEALRITLTKFNLLILISTLSPCRFRP